MSFLKGLLKGLSALTIIIAIISGMAFQQVLTLDFPLHPKIVSLSLLFLIPFVLFANDMDKERMKL